MSGKTSFSMAAAPSRIIAVPRNEPPDAPDVPSWSIDVVTQGPRHRMPVTFDARRTTRCFPEPGKTPS